MKQTYQTQKGKPYPPGINAIDNGIQIVVPLPGKKKCGVILKGKQFGRIQIPFLEEYATGNLYTVQITGLDFSDAVYQFYVEDKKVTDPYAHLIEGKEKWGRFHEEEQHEARICLDSYDWVGDCKPCIPYHESVFYQLHVRGFTKHASSEVTGRGTYKGVIEKIPYLKELGITGVCFMPMYEFDEILQNPGYMEMDDSIAPFMDESKQTWKYKINYWGFADAFYFAPKRSYSSIPRADVECKDMIKALHKAGIEVIMQMYFPPEIPQKRICEAVNFWVEVYHVDGFFLQGYHIPKKMLVEDAMLSDTKLIFESAPEVEEKKRGSVEEEKPRNCACINYDFMYDARKFLKGDEDMLKKMAVHFRDNPKHLAIINQIAAYNSFTLMDIVSYDRKHNEENGEDNHDGNEYNYSWNCGVEGHSKKRTVVELRLKQIKNALCMVFLSQGVPLLQAGDEFGNSHNGNNNAYCQDNVINWLNWGQLKKEQDIFQFAKQLIAFRKDHPILHLEKEMRIMDYISCGYPDLSYHGDMAWYAEFANYNRHMGIMYCGKYARKNHTEEDDFIYVLYNMHWMDHDFALPKLPEDRSWYICVDTAEKEQQFALKAMEKEKQLKVSLPPRSIQVLIGKKQEK